MLGLVKEFDDGRGVGIVSSEGSDFPFHCTRIADGTRTIAPGTTVEFEVAAGLPGQWEAVGVRAVDKL